MPLTHWNSTSRISLLYSFDVPHPLLDQHPYVLLRHLEENNFGLFTVGKHFVLVFYPRSIQVALQTVHTEELLCESLQQRVIPELCSSVCTQQRCWNFRRDRERFLKQMKVQHDRDFSYYRLGSLGSLIPFIPHQSLKGYCWDFPVFL